ncbi:hypothetical protein [Candidatus Formimonas warabiya]|uniref:Uncharacterized protein n=1 Tax=Formimonas warabiya TaxID=1761012 RepID=A0A3G1KYV5_FORW1|nr:hypothetical protein [Candidatus Formimonas warabiya]ATW27668.1 hypothetical protein DCMF_25535 [Candidatus Formimonas warabiya]
MANKLQNRTGVYLFFFLFFCIIFLILRQYAAASTHLWPLAAVHFDEPSAETPTFKMTEEDFINEQDALKLRVTLAHDKLLASLPDAQQILLKNAQSAWQSYYEKYAGVLKNQLDEPVKVFYGIEGQERKTNIYKDIVLAILEQRATDLESWVQGRYVYLDPGEVKETQEMLNEEKRLLYADFLLNNSTMDRIFIDPMQEVQNYWYAFLQSNTRFIEDVLKNSASVKIAEELLQVRRMHDLTLLHIEGSAFFHREREE